MKTMFYNEPLKSFKLPQIEYSETGVTKNGEFFPSDRPRLLFAKMLEEIEHSIKAMKCWYEWDHYINVFEDSKVHRRTVFNPTVQIGKFCVIGGAGFGIEKDGEKNIPIAHLGNVVLEDNVIIHNNVCIDRGVLGSTVIGEGTIIDNLVHIAHNAQIGKNCQIVAGSIIGGSVIIGNNVFIGINASIKNKVRIGNDVTIGMGAVVTKDIPDGVTVIGNPAKPMEGKK